MLFRGEVRCIAVYLLQYALQGNGAAVTSSRDNPIQGGKSAPLRSVEVYTDDVKTGQGGAPPQFRTDVLTTLEINVEGKTRDEAQTVTDTICDTIENTLLNGASLFLQQFEMIDRVESQANYTTDGKRHQFSVVMEISAHVTEQFEPTLSGNLNGINIYVDDVRAFDANGTYQPQFNYPVSAAPRAAGPDGRVEIGASVDFGPAIVTEDGVALTDENGNAIIAPDQMPDGNTKIATEDGVQLVDEYGNAIAAPGAAPDNDPNLATEDGSVVTDEDGDDIVAP